MSQTAPRSVLCVQPIGTLILHRSLWKPGSVYKYVDFATMQATRRLLHAVAHRFRQTCLMMWGTVLSRQHRSVADYISRDIFGDVFVRTVASV